MKPLLSNPWLQSILLSWLAIWICPTSASEQTPSISNGIQILSQRPLHPVAEDTTLLRELSVERTGIAFENMLDPLKGLQNQVLFNGSGVAIGDIDGDDLPEIYFCGLDAENQLYRNRGDLRFSMEAVDSPLACPGQYSTGAVFADVDMDGDLDLLVSSLGKGVRLFQNDGTGAFTESTKSSGLATSDASMTLALADVDKDGDLDLYVANFQIDSLQDRLDLRFSLRRTQAGYEIAKINGRDLTTEERKRYRIQPNTMEVEEHGQADRLFLNQGDGTFSLAEWSEWFRDEENRPMEPVTDWGLSAMFHDMNQDGWPDLYVCNDTHSPDRIWINQQGKAFRAIDALAIRQSSLSSMGIDFSDIDRDGDDDFFVADMLSRDHEFRQTQLVSRANLHPVGAFTNRPQYMKNTLFLNQGASGYAEIAQLAGVEASEWSWSPIFLDVDLDGWPDLLITTGLERGLRNADARRRIDNANSSSDPGSRTLLALRSTMRPLSTPNVVFRSTGRLKFEDQSDPWNFHSERVSQGMALGDLDRDGDLDIVINCMNAPALVYENTVSKNRITVQVKDPKGRNASIGTRLIYRDQSGVQSKEVTSGGRYLSGDQQLVCFAAPSEFLPASLEIQWATGETSEWTNIQPNMAYVIGPSNESKSQAGSNPATHQGSPWFEDVSEILPFRHHEIHFNDFDRQALLPRRLSQSGPGVCWADIDQDGWMDLVLGTGRGGSLKVFLNDQGRQMNPVETSKFLGKMSGDVSALLWNPYGPSISRLWIGLSNYETGSNQPPAVIEVEFSGQGMNARPILKGQDWPVSCMALGDLDGDGDLDLFVAGHSKGGDYPGRSDVTVLLAEGASWVEDPFAVEGLKAFGVVNSATISDIDQDGRMELIVACEWDSIRVLHRTEQGWKDKTTALGLDRWIGLWQSVQVADLNGDDRMDLVAGNWGLNNRYGYYLSSGIGAYHGDVDGNGIREVLEVYREAGSDRWLPWKHLDTLQLFWPDIGKSFPDHATFSRADAKAILGIHLQSMTFAQINTLETMAWIQTASGFQSIPLPIETQMTPVFGMEAVDFDADGIQGLFFAQNFFGTNPDQSRMDAGWGLLLQGKGNHEFNVVEGTSSRIQIPGEQRAVAAADFNRDARMDLLVTQNGNSAKLFRNLQTQKGVRVRLIGPPGNFAGIGARLRLVDGHGQSGPWMEIQAGSGYLSQRELTPLLTHPGKPNQVEVRWPSGKIRRYLIDSLEGEIKLTWTNGD